MYSTGQYPYLLTLLVIKKIHIEISKYIHNPFIRIFKTIN